MTEQTTSPNTQPDSAATSEAVSPQSPAPAADDTQKSPDETESTGRAAYDEAIASGLSDTEARGDYETAIAKSEMTAFHPTQRVTWRGAAALVSGVHADGTLDLHILNEDGSIKRSAEGNPLWYERIDASEVTAEG